MRHRAYPLAFLALLLSLHAGPAEEKVRFNRDIRPILSENCFQCHGPDANQRKADFRLDLEEEAFADLGGEHALVAGDPEKSILYQRIAKETARRRMPPAKTGKKLTPEQIDLIRRWIEQGAKWEKHWSFIPPARPPVPEVEAKIINPIDAFLAARHEAEQVAFAPEADRRTLIRRLYFDLIGLPPTNAEVEAFLNDDSPKAYEKVVDHLLASPHYGERMAVYWLDVVRFADTNGIHSDNHREIAPYRDYVIQAFNDNLPFDRFTKEQLAGDLLPNPTNDQKIASGFNRLLMTTREGGAQAKEYLAKYAADRVRNTSTIFLGMTLGCAECHDHKFDPFTQKEFYQFAAIFADLREVAVGQQPTVRIFEEEQQQKIRSLDEDISTLKAEMEFYRGIPDRLDEVQSRIRTLEQEKNRIVQSAPETLISMSGKPRTMRILPRGNWQDDSGEIVEPGTPASLTPMKSDQARATRLDLAEWMVDERNPTFARVFVNRLWKLAFGRGIVKTLDDFGAQGTWPTHPELLDWLAVDFRESGWDVKRMLKLMVMSRAYRQTSQVTPELREKDPYNQLFARQGRYRLDAEIVRDNALSVSGLLSKKIGGRSVKPYQPSGYWVHLNFPRRTWQKDSGENLYRRGLYTYWCRTFLHPSLLAFDAPTREECAVERPRSNTPQQALVLLNDPTYVEAARVLATKLMSEAKTVEGRIRRGYERVLQRSPQPTELQLLTNLYRQHAEEHRQEPEKAKSLISIGEAPLPKDHDPVELAAWTSVARVLLNLHETITRN